MKEAQSGSIPNLLEKPNSTLSPGQGQESLVYSGEAVPVNQ